MSKRKANPKTKVHPLPPNPYKEPSIVVQMPRNPDRVLVRWYPETHRVNLTTLCENGELGMTVTHDGRKFSDDPLTQAMLEGLRAQKKDGAATAANMADTFPLIVRLIVSELSRQGLPADGEPLVIPPDVHDPWEATLTTPGKRDPERFVDVIVPWFSHMQFQWFPAKHHLRCFLTYADGDNVIWETAHDGQDYVNIVHAEPPTDGRLSIADIEDYPVAVVGDALATLVGVIIKQIAKRGEPKAGYPLILEADTIKGIDLPASWADDPADSQAADLAEPEAESNPGARWEDEAAREAAADLAAFHARSVALTAAGDVPINISWCDDARGLSLWYWQSKKILTVSVSDTEDRTYPLMHDGTRFVGDDRTERTLRMLRESDDRFIQRLVDLDAFLCDVMKSLRKYEAQHGARPTDGLVVDTLPPDFWPSAG